MLAFTTAAFQEKILILHSCPTVVSAVFVKLTSCLNKGLGNCSRTKKFELFSSSRLAVFSAVVCEQKAVC